MAMIQKSTTRQLKKHESWNKCVCVWIEKCRRFWGFVVVVVWRRKGPIA